MPWWDGEFRFKDLYYLRYSSDHVEPLHRLFLFMNASVFGLNLKVEGAAALLCLCAIVLVLLREFNRNLPPGTYNTVNYRSFATVVLLFGFFSLNAIAAYRWTIIGFVYSIVLFGMIFFCLLARQLREQRFEKILFPLFLLFLLFIGDTVTGLFCVAGIFALLLYYIFEQRSKVALQLIVSTAVSLALYYWFRAGMVEYISLARPSLAQMINYPIEYVHVVPQLILYPFGHSLLAVEFLRELVGDRRYAALHIIGAMVLLWHLACWYWVYRYRLWRPAFVPVCLLIVCYGFIFGMIFQRALMWGDNGPLVLLHKHYVRSTQIGIWACLWITIYVLPQLAAQSLNRYSKMFKPAAITAAVLFIALQLQITYLSWASLPRVYKDHAGLLEQLDRAVSGRRALCKLRMSFCTIPVAQRTRTIEFLQANRLNGFNDGIVARYARLSGADVSARILEPSQASPAALAAGKRERERHAERDRKNRIKEAAIRAQWLQKN